MLIIKATDTHLEYVILVAFSRRQWLRECASVLHYAYIAWLVLLRIEMWISFHTPGR